jgi:hypothetical protein
VRENFNNRDLIYSSSKALKDGDWELCYSYLEQLSIWKTLPDAEHTK